MAIKINAGTAPPAGRLTMPKGTYLPNQQPFDNPGTSAFGSIAGAVGMNPAVPPPGTLAVGNRPGGNTAQFTLAAQTQTTNPLAWWIQRVDAQMRAEPNMVQMAQQFDYNKAENMYGSAVAGVMQTYSDLVRGIATPQRQTTNAFKPPQNQTNSLVGQDISSHPVFLSSHQVNSLFSNLTPQQRAAQLRSRGYERTYEAGVGEIWVKAGEGQGGIGSPATSGSLDERGRPEFVDPTLLERGERVTAQSGLTFVGGTPTEDGKAQYAMTIPGGANDTKGRFKWKSTVKQDENGNWVRVYQKVLRKVYTRSHRKKLYGRRENDTPPAQVTSGEISQLVNLRADYG